MVLKSGIGRRAEKQAQAALEKICCSKRWAERGASSDFLAAKRSFFVRGGRSLDFFCILFFVKKKKYVGFGAKPQDSIIKENLSSYWRNLFGGLSPEGAE